LQSLLLFLATAAYIGFFLQLFQGSLAGTLIKVRRTRAIICDKFFAILALVANHSSPPFCLEVEPHYILYGIASIYAGKNFVEKAELGNS